MNEDSSWAKRSQYQIPTPVVNDEERLAKKKGWYATTIAEKDSQSKNRGRSCVDRILFEHRQDSSRYHWGCLCVSVVQLQPVHFSSVNQENRWKGWTVSYVNVSVQYYLQQHGRYSCVWWMYEISLASRLSHAWVHLVTARANLLTDHIISRRPIRARYMHF